MGWWHIEPNDGGMNFRQVADYYLNEEHITIPIKTEHLRGFKVISRNTGEELAFVDDNNSIIISLGDLSKWPKASEPKYFFLKHVKLELQYAIAKPKSGRLADFKLRLIDEKEFVIRGPTHPEFYLIIPKGTKLKNLKAKLIVYGKKGNDPFPEPYEIPLELHRPYKYEEDKKEKYSSIITKEDYEGVQLFRNYYNTEIKVDYTIANSEEFLFIPSIALVLFLFSALNMGRIIANVNNFEVAYLVVLISSLAIFLNFYTNNYEIPYKVATFLLFIFSLGIVTLEMGIYTFGFNMTNTTSNMTNITSNVSSNMIYLLFK